MSSKPYIIGISGGSGSGKTTFLKRLKSILPKGKISYINQDDYYLPREEQESDAKGIKNFDLPTSIRVSDLIKDLKDLLAGKEVNKNKYTFNNVKAEQETFKIMPAQILIIEGLFVFHYEELSKYFDLKIFIEANDELKILRRITRDRVERNYPLEDVTYRYQHHVMPAYRKYIEPHRAYADIIVNNNKDFETGLEVIKGYIVNRLN